MKYDDFFTTSTSLEHPHGWQQDLAATEICCNRLVRIPTGFGKTLGVVTAWSYHRLHRKDERWPRRLIRPVARREITHARQVA